MKFMKKTIFACLLAALMVTAVACGGSNEASSTPESSQPETSVSQSEPPVSSESQAPAETLTVTGVVEDAAMHSLVLKLEDGSTLSFTVPDEADRTKVDELTIGDTVTVTYTGTIEGVDTSKVVVTALETVKKGEAAETPASSKAESSKAESSTGESSSAK